MIVARTLAAALDRHKAGRRDEAAVGYRRVLVLHPSENNALHLLGVAAWERGEAGRADTLMRRAVAAHPGFIDARVNLGKLLNTLGRSREAADQFRAVVLIDPTSPEFWFRLGDLLTSMASGGGSTLPEAIAALGHALALRPFHPEALHELGLALRLAGRLDEAIDAQRRAIDQRADLPATHMSLGNACLEAGERERGLAYMRRAVALLPAEAATQYNLGNLLHTMGQPAGAERAYRRSWLMGVANGLARAGMVQLLAGRAAEAEATLRASLEQPGILVSVPIEELTKLMIAQGRTKEARAYFEHLFDNPPAGGDCRAECLTALADIDLAEGRTKEATVLLDRVRGDNCRLFTVRSIASFRRTLDEIGMSLVRPRNPDPSRPRIISSTLATHGRFAHNALEYVLVRLYAEKYGYVLETPDWVGGYYFDLDDPQPSGPLRPLLFPRRIVNDLVAGTRAREPISDCDVLSPLFLFEHKEAYRERVQSWLKPRKAWAPFIEPAVERLRARGGTIVAIHIRRGDFVHFNYPITPTGWYVEWLRSLWPTLDRPVLYVASDDLDGVRADFAEFSPVVCADVAPPWPGLEFLQDFHVLSCADVVGISASSGYSLLAARLNTTARLFVEPDMAARRVRPFAPWTP